MEIKFWDVTVPCESIHLVRLCLVYHVLSQKAIKCRKKFGYNVPKCETVHLTLNNFARHSMCWRSPFGMRAREMGQGCQRWFVQQFVLMFHSTMNLNNSFDSLVWFTAYMTP